MQINKQYKVWLFGAVLLLAFVAASVLTFGHSKELIEKGYLASEGNAAQNFAVLTAANITLTDDDVARLKSYSYDEVQESEENKDLQKMMKNSSFSQKVDYAYLMIHLKNDEVKYTVTEETKNRFDAPIGTKLDIMWLLDVNVSERSNENNMNEGNTEFHRYSYYIEDDALIFGEAPTYIFNSSEWGDHICGYAPIYTSEGTYIGVIGVELQTGDYDSYCGQAIWALRILMIVTLIMLSLLFLYIYLHFRKEQFEKVYVDSLTQVYNRSYYNNQFVRKMNARRSGSKFALLIADVDWFKKVNDTFGHEVGDEVLTELGQILTEVFGREYVARFGGEEFVAGLWFENEKKLCECFDALFSKIENYKFTSREITLSISLGCSYMNVSELEGWILSGLLRAADCKLYEAKESGRKKYLIEAYNDNKEYRKVTADKNGGQFYDTL